MKRKCVFKVQGHQFSDHATTEDSRVEKAKFITARKLLFRLLPWNKPFCRCVKNGKDFISINFLLKLYVINHEANAETKTTQHF